MAGALGVALGSTETAKLTERPTENLAAYDLYLKGRAITGGDPASIRQAIRNFEQAVTLDSTFADAWARLAMALSNLYSNSTPDPSVATRAKDAADRALALAPESGTTHVAQMNYYFLVGHDPAKAMESAGQVSSQPRTTPTAGPSARWSAPWAGTTRPSTHLERARTIDPRSVRIVNSLQNTFMWLRRYPEALAASEAASPWRRAT